MLIADSGITLDFPSNWVHFIESGRFVFHTPDREEVIIAGRRIVPEGNDRESAMVLDRMIDTGMEAMKHVLASTDLQITQPISEHSKDSTFRVWTVEAETIARDVFFGQAFFAHSDGTILVTYEAPFIDGADLAFSELLGMIRKD
jgi:hypothetical protein